MNRETWQAITQPPKLWTRSEVLLRPSPVPPVPGVYAWYFREVPGCIGDDANYLKVDGFTLLYVGISPRRPVAGRSESTRQNLRKRIRSHFRGNASASTLRLTLGCLLAEQLSIRLQPSPSGRLTFGDGERVLDDWMEANALVVWSPSETPWIDEQEFITRLSLPLNIQGNLHPFAAELSALRSSVRRAARADKLQSQHQDQ